LPDNGGAAGTNSRSRPVLSYGRAQGRLALPPALILHS